MAPTCFCSISACLSPSGPRARRWSPAVCSFALRAPVRIAARGDGKGGGVMGVPSTSPGAPLFLRSMACLTSMPEVRPTCATWIMGTRV